MKYYIITGEASGDLHGSNLMKAILEKDGDAEFRFWGGDRMKQAGGDMVMHYRDLAFMGFIEVAANIKTILRNLKLCKRDILSYQPDAVILIDYPGFNLRIADFTHKKGFKNFYYISPQVWAWKKSRIYQIKRTIDKMFVILPFEKDFYARHNVEVEFVGHPLLDAITKDDIRENPEGSPDKPVIGILPGSRKQEIMRMLPVMLKMGPEFPGYDFVVGAAPSIEDEFYFELAGNNIVLSREGSLNLLRKSSAAIVTSGTATLETAMMNVPQVVCYKGSLVSYLIARWLVRVPFISLVNLISGKEIVKELIQNDFTRANLKKELEKILQPDKKDEMKQHYTELRKKLGGPGASQKTATEIINYIREISR